MFTDFSNPALREGSVILVSEFLTFVVFVLLTAGLAEVFTTYLWKYVIISKFTKEHRHVNTRVQFHKSTIRVYSTQNICVSVLH